MESTIDAIHAEIEAYRNYVLAVDRAKRELDNRLREAGVAQDYTGQKPPRYIDVLIRTSAGPAPKVYHFAEDACKRVSGSGRDRENFRTYTEGEAKKKGLQRCTACEWPASE